MNLNNLPECIRQLIAEKAIYNNCILTIMNKYKYINEVFDENSIILCIKVVSRNFIIKHKYVCNSYTINKRENNIIEYDSDEDNRSENGYYYGDFIKFLKHIYEKNSMIKIATCPKTFKNGRQYTSRFKLIEDDYLEFSNGYYRNWNEDHKRYDKFRIKINVLPKIIEILEIFKAKCQEKNEFSISINI